MDNYLVTEPCSTIRKLARERLKGNWIPVYFGVILYAALFAMVPQFFATCTNIGVVEQYYEELGTTLRYSTVSSFYQFFFTGVFTFGITAFILTFVRLRKVRPELVLSGFELYFKCLLLSIVTTGLIILWAFLLVIPGIVAAYRYSQAYYILADDPTKGVMQCIQESKEMMRGNKMKRFLLDISFIGWYFLASIPVAILLAVLKPTLPAPVFILYCVSILVEGIVVEYMLTSGCVFYELVSGHLVRSPALS